MRYDPIDAYDRHSSYEYDLMRYQQMVSDEMYSLKHDALERISKVVHPEIESQFIKVLELGMCEKIPEAENIARILGLNQAHFIALSGDEREMGYYLDKHSFNSY